MASILFGLQEKIESEGEDIKAAILPLLKLITLTLFGFILIKFQLIPKPTLKFLSKLVFALFLPCLMFTHLGPAISLQNIITWWFIPVNLLISTAIGCALGYLVALVCRPPPEFFRFTIIMTGFGNTGNIPLAVVTSICHTKDNPFGAGCRTKGIAYVAFAQWVAVILVYTLVYHMMEPPMAYYEIVEDDSERSEIEQEEEEEISVENQSLLAEAEFTGIEDQETVHCKTPFIARVFSGISHTNGHDRDSTESISCLVEPKMVKKIRVVAEQTPIHNVLQPPTVASLLAIVIGVIPAAKELVYGNNAPFEFIIDSFSILSEAMVPSVMLVLGGMLSEGPNNSSLGMRTTIGIIVARLLVLPIIGIGVIYLADKWNLLIPGDLMYRFVLLMQYTTPSAILLGAVASLRGYAVKEASAVLFWQHACAVVSLSGFIILYFHILISYI
ncbi:protein PIN-LIKES 2-like [Mercurialis annua]|uniref:protein PIN-LIKES 2-like n=1 Tax=Mercurialis annua TaxID=3986 RepID=UPI00215ECDEE|nr:protein PIN-LIKES 2-like [Mercurialis annua]